MELTSQNINYLLGFIALISIAFNVWSKVQKPQTELDKREALNNEETENKAKILAEKVKWEKESNERRFTEMGKRLDDAFALAQNHTHSISIQVETLTSLVNSLNLDLRSGLTKLETIINERLARK